MADCCGPTEPTPCCGPTEQVPSQPAACCEPSGGCCGGGPVTQYHYGPAPYVTGEVATFAGAVPRVAAALVADDTSGALRMRLNLGRDHYRVRPGLYAVGEPDDTAPVLVTANYKLSFDALRSQLAHRAAWLLVLDTHGVNVWCAAGKGTFSTAELIGRIKDTRLEQVVSHTKLVLPQLGATGVAAHEVRAATGFSVIWGPVRAADLEDFLVAGLKATPAMRRVEFPLRERAKLVGVELSVLWRRNTLLGLAATAGVLAFAALAAPALLAPLLLTLLAALVAVVAGAAVAPLLLPWLPGRSFALKGAVTGAVLLAAVLWLAVAGGPFVGYAGGLVLAGAALSSYLAMNFTGSSTFTSPSGVEWEMRRAIPLQVVGVTAGVAIALFSLLRG